MALIKFLGKRSLIKKQDFKMSKGLFDLPQNFERIQTTMRRQIMSEQEMDIINMGGNENMAYLKIKPYQKK